MTLDEECVEKPREVKNRDVKVPWRQILEPGYGHEGPAGVLSCSSQTNYISLRRTEKLDEVGEEWLAVKSQRQNRGGMDNETR